MRITRKLRQRANTFGRELERLKATDDVLHLELTIQEALFLWRHCRLIANMRFLDQEERTFGIDLSGAVFRLLKPYPAITQMMQEVIHMENHAEGSDAQA